MNCQSIQNRIDKSFDPQNLSAPEMQHLKTCAACQNFDSERKRLGELLRNLEAVNAPSDFNFRLKAKLRESDSPKSFAFARRFVWLAPSSLAALILGFVVLKPAVIVSPPSNSEKTTVANVQIEPTAPERSLIEAVESAQKPIESPTNTDAQSLPEPIQIATARRTRSANASAAAPRKNQPSNRPYKEQIISRDVTVSDPGAPLMPPGFSSPLQIIKKTDAKELLRTFGVETNQELAGFLRVVSTGDQAARRGLQKDDVIEKINDQAPASLSNNSFKELKLTVRRQTKIEEINIPLKP